MIMFDIVVETFPYISMVGWLVGWLAGWLVGWLVAWLVGWLAISIDGSI